MLFDLVGAWHGVDAKRKPEPRTNVIPHSPNGSPAGLKMKKTSGLPGANRTPDDRSAYE
jgi:hypothetical protein